MIEGKGPSSEEVDTASTSLLQESAKLFALTGGYRMPGKKLCLHKAFWLCRPNSEGKERDHDL